MQFYNREKELAHMRLLKESSPSFLVITGKRRVGIAARQIENSEQLEKEGFLVWTLGDLL